MDARAVALVRASFKAVAAVDGGPEKLTRSFYGILFADNPGVRDFFPAAMDLQRDKLVAAIAAVVDQLENPERILPFLAQLGRDHRKYGVVDAHYTAVGNALIKALAQFSGAELWTDEVDAAWRDAIALMAGVMMDAANTDEGPPRWQGTVVECTHVLQDLTIVKLKLDQPMAYDAGQYVSVQVPSRPRMWRNLSPAAPADPDGLIEFHVRRVSSGWVSPAIVANTQVGDQWLIGSPLGSMTRGGAGDGARVLIGSGTGIAPLRAQVLEMAARGDTARTHLFFGGRFPCDLYDYRTLCDIAATNPWLTVVAVAEDETDPWWYDGPPLGSDLPALIIGQIGKVVAEYGPWENCSIQIVGSPAMINTTKFRLQAVGVDLTRVRHDQW